MTAFDWLERLRPPEVEPITLAHGEFQVARTPGCVVKGGIPWVGGDLILTNQRLLMTPLNTKDMVKLTSAGLKVLQLATGPIPHVGQVMAVIGWAQKFVRGVSSDTQAIAAVTVGNPGASLIHPPTIEIHRSGLPSIEVGVAATRWTPTISRRNIEARDRFLAEIIRALGLPKA
jgi:hypothetical protein